MREPNALISTEALARELGDSNLRVFDCTTYLEPPPPGSDDPYIAVPGRSMVMPMKTVASPSSPYSSPAFGWPEPSRAQSRMPAAAAKTAQSTSPTGL